MLDSSFLRFHLSDPLGFIYMLVEFVNPSKKTQKLIPYRKVSVVATPQQNLSKLGGSFLA